MWNPKSGNLRDSFRPVTVLEGAFPIVNEKSANGKSKRTSVNSGHFIVEIDQHIWTGMQIGLMPFSAFMPRTGEASLEQSQIEGKVVMSLGREKYPEYAWGPG